MEIIKGMPQDYMTVGEAAKRMGVTVRTLQYYDQVGLLSPTAQSEGGRRLYTYQDLVCLHQILSLKQLGFSLDDIKNRLIPLDTPDEVAKVLEGQAASVERKIQELSESLTQLQALREEVLQMQTVDFKKYADIIVNLQMNNEYYWLIKHFDEETMDHIRTHFDQETGLAFMERFVHMQDQAAALQQQQVPPGSAQGQALAKEFWAMIQEFTGGDLSLLAKLEQLGQLQVGDTKWQQRQTILNQYMAPALEAYFTAQGMNPFGEGAQ